MDAVRETVGAAVEGVRNLAVSAEPQTQGKSKKDKKNKGGDNADGPLELDPPASFIQERINLFDKVKAEQDAWVAKQPREDITITLASGDVRVGKSWEITPGEIARGISKSLYERTVVARLDGEELWDLERPLEKSCKLELLDFEHQEGKNVFWHSSAHILGEAAERRFGCSLCIGPPVSDGFYYEMALPDGAAVQPTDHQPLEKIFDKAVKEKQKFERLTLTKDQLLEMFKYNKYKQHIIKDKIPDGTSTTVYRNGPLIDLCRGPHVPHTGRIKAFAVMRNSASYFLGDAKNDSLQRIYGVSFPDKKLLDEHKMMLEEAAKRDHRKIGQEQELFFFHDQSPGSCFLLPHGQIIFNALQTAIREEYWKRGYSEVQTPNMYNSSLWKQSGHWAHYKDDMFTFDVEKDQWALKPMNCPAHCLMFGFRERSYRELPIRLADFGVLHRNEASGALTGLTRVRRFQQDDAHIFCMEEQIEEEILGLFDFLQSMYGRFGFTFKFELSTRPEGFLGEVATWDKAEAMLKKALDTFCDQHGSKWELNPGDGAFYGPKIDIKTFDALKRQHQCATIQLDFQLPQQFNLEFRSAESGAEVSSSAPHPTHHHDHDHQHHGHSSGKTPHVSSPTIPSSTNNNLPDAGISATFGGDASQSQAIPTSLDIAAQALVSGTVAEVKESKHWRRPLTPGCSRPVMIHRAILGSFERFLAIITEHFAGKWPFWLSPRQVLIVPVMPQANPYVLQVQSQLRSKGIHADVDISGNTMQKKILLGNTARYNFIFVVGAKEQESKTVNIRNRDKIETQKLGELVPLEEVMDKLCRLRDERRLENDI